MGTVVAVPQTRDMKGEELSGDEAWAALRTYGGRRLLADSFHRFRYADGFTNARALALQFVLAVVPLTIAMVGVAASLHTESVGRVVELTLSRIVPGASSHVVQDSLGHSRHSALTDLQGEIAMWSGLAFAMLNLASAMAQIERGINRIYGTERDRPFLAKYARSLALAVAAGAPMLGGFLMLVAGDPIGGALTDTFGSSAAWSATAWRWLRIPAGIALVWTASAVIFRWSPRRRQPGYTWLAFGSAVHLALWLAATWLLAFYVANIGSFGTLYGPLTAFVALLLWSYLTAASLFLGIAFAAQLEATRAGMTVTVHADPGPEGHPASARVSGQPSTVPQPDAGYR
ncbi:MAG TPA: YihY/virulence factor BrkB family protein [Streptomyces sp.]|nr:YihY/virulence factor BrkB family protein [Streptomyces sp.]